MSNDRILNLLQILLPKNSGRRRIVGAKRHAGPTALSRSFWTKKSRGFWPRLFSITLLLLFRRRPRGLLRRVRPGDDENRRVLHVVPVERHEHRRDAHGDTGVLGALAD